MAPLMVLVTAPQSWGRRMPCGRAIGLVNRASRSLCSGTWNSFAVSKLLRHLALSLLRESHVFRRTLATFSKIKSASTFWKVGDSETSEKSNQRKNSLIVQLGCSTLQKWLWTASILYTIYISLSDLRSCRDRLYSMHSVWFPPPIFLFRLQSHFSDVPSINMPMKFILSRYSSNLVEFPWRYSSWCELHRPKFDNI